MTLLEQTVTSSRRLRDRTRKLYLGAVRSFLEHAGREPRRWTGAAVEAWRDALEKRVTPETVNVQLAAVKFASERYNELGHGPDFARGAEFVPAPKHKTREALTFEQFGALIMTCADGRPIDVRDRAILCLLGRTGLRREGCVKLDRDDLDGRKLRVVLKGGRRHTIPALDAETMLALEDWMLWLRDHGVRGGAMFRRLYAPTIEGHVKVGPRLGVDGLWKMVRERGAEAGLRHMHPHLLRHSFVTWARATGWPDWKIASYTGHRVLPSGEVPSLGAYTSAPDDKAPGDEFPTFLR